MARDSTEVLAMYRSILWPTQNLVRLRRAFVLDAASGDAHTRAFCQHRITLIDQVLRERRERAITGKDPAQ